MLISPSIAPLRIPPASPTLDPPALGPPVLDIRWAVGNQVERFGHWSRQRANKMNKAGLQRQEVSSLIIVINNSIEMSEKEGKKTPPQLGSQFMTANEEFPNY